MLHFYFKPTYTLTAVVLILLPILLSLGSWQLHRAEEKRLLQTTLETRSKIASITLEQAERLPDNHYYSVKTEGYFDNAHSFLLDNQLYHHAVGYQIITPFITEKTHRWVLINRGWLPMQANRQLALKIPVISGKARLKGILYVPQHNPFITHKIQSISWPLTIQAINIPTVSQYLNRPIYPFIILLDPQSSYGFIRHWQMINMKAAVHTGYAFQWFSMAGALIIIYLAMSIRRVC